MLFADNLKPALETMLLVSSEPLDEKKIAGILEVKPRDVKIQMEELMSEYEQRGSGIRIIQVAGGYLFTVNPELSEYVKQFYKPKYNSLSNAALETLAIIAYRQPITRAEIEKIRGVNSDKIVTNLHEKGLIKDLGKKDAPGRPLIYGTTREFLLYFGINSLEELPGIEG